MNLVRKFVSTNASDTGGGSSGDNALSLTHLKKLFAEFKQPANNATVESQEKKFYNMLPLFCKVGFQETLSI